jgi:soluble lytic murein transglycosylase-like protein
VRGIATGLALLTLALPANAHTTEETEAWEETWFARVQEQGALDPLLITEWTDMVARHPEHYSQPVPLDPGSYNTGSWESLIQIHFPEADWPWARRVMACESKGNPDATNSTSGAAGLFQFIPSTWEWAKPYPGASPYDAPANVEAAAWLLATYGPSQWSCK